MNEPRLQISNDLQDDITCTDTNMKDESQSPSPPLGKPTLITANGNPTVDSESHLLDSVSRLGLRGNLFNSNVCMTEGIHTGPFWGGEDTPVSKQRPLLVKIRCWIFLAAAVAI